jgi:hypothetical protein
MEANGDGAKDKFATEMGWLYEDLWATGAADHVWHGRHGRQEKRPGSLHAGCHHFPGAGRERC